MSVVVVFHLFISKHLIYVCPPKNSDEHPDIQEESVSSGAFFAAFRCDW